MANDEEGVYDLCDDCDASFRYFWDNAKEFAALADRLSHKEDSEK